MVPIATWHAEMVCEIVAANGTFSLIASAISSEYVSPHLSLIRYQYTKAVAVPIETYNAYEGMDCAILTANGTFSWIVLAI